MNKWSAMPGNTGGRAYVPSYVKAPAKFFPKKAVRSFRDLDVYRSMMECSVMVGTELLPALTKQKFPLAENMMNCALSIPLHIAEAHGMRFSNFEQAVATLERAMLGCNKMIVYLEQAAGLCKKLNAALTEDISSRYMQTRGKILRLERSWQKFRGYNTSSPK